MHRMSRPGLARRFPAPDVRSKRRQALDQPHDIDGRNVVFVLTKDFFFPFELDQCDLFSRYEPLKDVYLYALTLTPLSRVGEHRSTGMSRSEILCDYVMGEFLEQSSQIVEGCLEEDANDKEVQDHFEDFYDLYSRCSERLYWATEFVVGELLKIENSLERNHPDLCACDNLTCTLMPDGYFQYRLIYYQYKNYG